ncbi:MAG TPA: YncE family protein [Pyrinomonadaceae bacterium]|jgi:YVTN family beta-propeller protein|nr:YncE family protein [Pyrinomonadaceae bacterium]
MSFTLLPKFLLLAFIAGLSLTSQGTARSANEYKVIQTVKLGGDGGWDCLTVDSQARRLYISRGTHVMVVNADTGEVVGDIPGTNGVHGIAIVPVLGKGFTSNGRDNTVSVFDLKTLLVSKQIPVGKNPDIIVYDPASQLIFTGNGGSRDITVIDPASETVKGTIALDGKPEFAVADKGHVYVNLEDKSLIARIDSRKLVVDGRWPLAPGEEPTGLAIDEKHHRLFAACGNKLMVVVNTDNGKVVGFVPTGEGADGAEFDSSNQLAFSPNGADGTLTIIHEDSPGKFSVVQTVTTRRGARTMTLDPRTHHVFLVTAEFGPPPPPTAERPHPRPSIVPGSFMLLIVGKG